MNEEYLLGAYNSFGGQEKLGVDFDVWVSKIKDNEEYKQGMFNHFGGEGKLGATYDVWNSKVFGVKKKDTSNSTSPSQGLESGSESTSSAIATIEIADEELGITTIAEDQNRFDQLQKEAQWADKVYADVEAMRDATSLSMDEFEEAKVKAEQKLQGSTLETIEKHGKKALRIAQGVVTLGLSELFGDQEDFVSYKDETEQKAREALKEEGVAVTPETLQQKTSQIAYNEQVESLIEKKEYDYMKNLPEDVKEELRINQIFANRANQLKEKVHEAGMAIALKKGEVTKKKAEENEKWLLENKESIESNEERIRSLQEQGKEVPQEAIDKHNEAVRVYEEKVKAQNELEKVAQGLVQEYNKHVNGLNESAIKQLDSAEKLDLLKREWGYWENMENIVLTSTGDLMAGGIGALAYVEGAKGELFGDDVALANSKFLSEKSTQLSEAMNQWRGEYRPRMEYDQISSWEDFGYFVSQETATQVPIVATIAIPYVGLTALGVSSGGGKYAEMKAKERETGDFKTYSLFQELTVPVIHGTAEAVFETVTRKILGRNLSGMEQRKLLQGSKNYFKETLKGAGRFAKDNLEELASEFGTETVHYVLDRGALGDEDREFQAMQVLTSTLASTGPMVGGAKLAGKAIKPFIPKTELEQMESYATDLFKLNQSIESATDADTKKLLLEKYRNKQSEAIAFTKKTVSKLGKVDRLRLKQAHDIAQEQAELRSQAEKILGDKGLSKEQKDELIKGLEKEFNTLEEKRDRINSGKPRLEDVVSEEEALRLKERAGDELQQESEEKGGNYEITDEQITKRAFEIYNRREQAQGGQQPELEDPDNPIGQNTGDNDESVSDSPIEPFDEEAADKELGELIGADETTETDLEKNIRETENKLEQAEQDGNADEAKVLRSVLERLKANLPTKVIFESGKTTVTGKGNENYQSRRKAVLESVEEGVFDNAPETEIDNPHEYSRELSEKSENPIEVAQAIEIERKQYEPQKQQEDDIESILLGGVSTHSYEQNTGLKSKDRSTAINKKYLRKNGKPLDMLAMEIEEVLFDDDYNANNERVTEDDVVDWMERLAEKQSKTEEQRALEGRFSELTGLPATKANVGVFAERASNPKTENHIPDAGKKVDDKKGTVEYFRKELGKESPGTNANDTEVTDPQTVTGNEPAPVDFDRELTILKSVSNKTAKANAIKSKARAAQRAGQITENELNDIHESVDQVLAGSEGKRATKAVDNAFEQWYTANGGDQAFGNKEAAREEYDGLSQDERDNYVPFQSTDTKFKAISKRNLNQLVRGLQRAFRKAGKKVKVSTNIQAGLKLLEKRGQNATKLQDVRNTKDVRRMEDGNGVPYGMVDLKTGNIYLDGERINANTPIHEFAHLWISSVQKTNPQLWEKMVSLAKQTPEWKRLKNDPNYKQQFGNKKGKALDNAIADEVWATIIGNRGENNFDAILKKMNGDRTLAQKVWDAVQDFWQAVRDMFGGIANLPFRTTFAKNVDAANERFNNDLDRLINGTLPKDHTMQLGNAGGILQAAGIPNLPIELRASLLNKKSKQKEHPFDLSEVKDLPRAVQDPIAVFNSSTMSGRKVVFTELTNGKENFVVALEVDTKNGKKIRVNDVRSVYPRKNIKIVRSLNDSKQRVYVDKQRTLDWLNQQQSNSAEVAQTTERRAKVQKLFETAKSKVENHQNPISDADAKDVRLQASVFHGSPHTFDRFSTDKIGMGEGNQAFGWGLYFSTLKEIAEEYAKRLRPSNALFGGKSTDEVMLENNNPVFSWIDNYVSDGLNHDQIVEKLEAQLNDTDWIKKNAWVEPKIKDALNYIKQNPVTKAEKNSNLYSVTLHKGKTPDRYTWLEWDKSVPKTILDKIANGFETIFGENISIGEPRTGEEVYDAIMDVMSQYRSRLEAKYGEDVWGRADKLASLFLLDAGIDGIKYPAESISRGATSDTARGFNYVVFDENAVTIEEHTRFQQGNQNPTDQSLQNPEVAAIADMALGQMMSGEFGTSDPVMDFAMQYASESELLRDDNGNVIGVKPEVLEEIRKEREQIETEARANGTWMKAPNGKKSNLTEEQWVAVRTERFKEWFGDWENDPANASKVVDENGEPLVVYHGTNQNFDEFSSFSGRYYFSSNFDVADSYASDTTFLVETFLNIRNPYIKDYQFNNWDSSEISGSDNITSVDLVAEAQQGEYDGAILENIIDPGLYTEDQSAGTNYVAFSSNQIKSATGNVGTFSNETGDIRFQTGANQLQINFDEKNRTFANGDPITNTNGDQKFTQDPETEFFTDSKGNTVPFKRFRPDGAVATDNLLQREGYSQQGTDFALVERQFTKDKNFNFTAGPKISNVNDVAWLFRALEDESIEQAFVVYIKEDGSYVVQHASQGTFTGTIVEAKMVIGNAIKMDAKQVFFIHNHPSGTLRASNADNQVYGKLKKGFDGTGIELGEGIIINLRTGKYATFDHNGYVVQDRETQNQEQQNVEVLRFNKQVFAENYNPDKISSSSDVAKLLSTKRYGISDKTEILVLNNQNKITGKFILQEGSLDDQYKQITSNVIQFGGTSVILYGNNENLKATATHLYPRLRKIDLTLLDAISMQGSNSKSLADGTLGEGKAEYSKENSNLANDENRTENTRADSADQRGEGAIRRSANDGTPQRELGEVDAVLGKIQEASDFIRESVEAARKKHKGLTFHQREDAEKQALYDYAKNNGIWFKDLYELGSPTGLSGNENTLALDVENGVVYKSNNLMNVGFLPSQLLEKVKLHNEIFPETKYEIAGATGFENKNRAPYVEVILSQKFVEDAVKATPQEISDYMESIGYKKLSDTSFSNGEYTVTDLYPRNVLKGTDGSIHVVDNNIVSEAQKNKTHAERFLDLLDRLEKDVDNFGRGTLGMNMPVVVAKMAIKTMRTTVKAGLNVAEAYKAGINYIKSTDWYKNLSESDKLKVDEKTFKTTITNLVRQAEDTDKKLNAIRQKIKDDKQSKKGVVEDLNDFLKGNKIEGRITPTEVNRLSKYAARVATAQDPQKAFDKFVDEFNKISLKAEARNKKKEIRDRAVVEKEVDGMLDNGIPENEIIDSFDTNRERDFAKDHIERRKEYTEEQLYKKVEESKNKSREEEKRAHRTSLRTMARNLAKRIADRQYVPKAVLRRAKFKRARALLINSSGAGGYAKDLMDKAYQQIYSYRIRKDGKYVWEKMGKKDRELLDEIIESLRIIEIDNDREARGLTPIIHTGNRNRRSEEVWLKKKREEIGAEKFDQLRSRADKYFDTFRELLDMKYNEGLISEESYRSIKELNYSPRKLLQALVDFNGDISERGKNKLQELMGDLSQSEIKGIKEGSDAAFMKDSESLLASALKAGVRNIYYNKLNRHFWKEYVRNKERYAELNAKDKLTRKERKELKALDEIYSKVRENPVVKQNKDGSLKRKYGTPPPNFTKVYFWENGVRQEFLMEDGFHQQWMNNVEGIFNADSKAKQITSWLSGSALLKYFATGNNPFFFIVNIPRDASFTYAFSNEYSAFLPTGIFQMAKDNIKAAKELTKNALGKDNLLEKAIEYGLSMEFLSQQGRVKKESLVGKFFNRIVPKTAQDVFRDLVGNRSAIMKFQTYSELLFRLGLMQRKMHNLLKEYGLKSIDQITDDIAVDNGFDGKQDMVDFVYEQGVAEARGILDFSQGGTLTKDLDALIPYANVAAQGTRKVIEQMNQNPKETVLKLGQMTALASSTIGGIGLMALSLLRGDDEEDKDKSVGELYIETIDGLSVYERTNYFHIPLGRRDKDGRLQSIRIAKDHQLAPLFLLGDYAFESVLRKLNGMDVENPDLLKERAVWAMNNNFTPIELPFGDKSVIESGQDLITSIPSVKAIMTYTTGHDFFYDRDLVSPFYKGAAKYEGLYDPDVEQFYKNLGQTADFSPIRSKAMIESFVTSPQTNPYVGFMYGGADALWGNRDEVGSNLKNNFEKAVKGRVLKSSSDYIRTLGKSKELQDMLEEAHSEDFLRREKRKEAIKDYNNGEMTKESLNNLSEELYGDKSKLFKEAKKKQKTKKTLEDADPNLRALKYSRVSVKQRAKIILKLYGDNLLDRRDKDAKKIRKQIRKVGGLWTESFVDEYRKLTRKN